MASGLSERTCSAFDLPGMVEIIPPPPEGIAIRQNFCSSPGLSWVLCVALATRLALKTCS